jgi:hypothetical protein
MLTVMSGQHNSRIADLKGFLDSTIRVAEALKARTASSSLQCSGRTEQQIHSIARLAANHRFNGSLSILSSIET